MLFLNYEKYLKINININDVTNYNNYRNKMKKQTNRTQKILTLNDVQLL